MGMSASQMRYCMLAGKKSDVEYQGQQINQQRTTLATQSSAYNTQLLDMQVPTPPSTSDYTTTNYNFSMGSVACSISGAKFNSATGKYEVSYSYKTTGSEAQTAQAIYTRQQTTDDKGTPDDTTDDVILPPQYFKGTGSTLTQLSNASDMINPASTSYNAQKATGLKAALATIYGDDYASKKYGDENTPVEYYFTENNGVYQFVTNEQLESLGTGDGTQAGSLKYSFVNDNATITVNDTLENAKVDWSDTGRMESVMVQDANGKETTYTLSVSTVTDNEAYEDAYNEYEYQKGLYDQEMESINAQLNIIQSQDKKLELKLQDLDTQQESLSTEMDSVKKVIDKNIETSFKTFA